MHTFFRNIEAKKKAIELYEEKLDALDIFCDNMNVETSFGNTNILVAGSLAHPPMVILHGSNGCAPVAIEAMINAVSDYRIYAIDIVGQPNLSEEIRPAMKDNSYGQWMYEIMTRLNLWNVILVGISFGGFICRKTLAFDEKRIARSFLIVPAGIVNGNPFKAIWNVFLPMKRFRQSGNKKHLMRFLGSLFSEEDEFANEFLSNLFLHYEMDFSPIPLIKKEEAKKIKTPLFIIGAERDLLFPGHKMLSKANQIFASLQETLLLKESKHVPGKNDNKKIVEFIKTHTK